MRTSEHLIQQDWIVDNSCLLLPTAAAAAGGKGPRAAHVMQTGQLSSSLSERDTGRSSVSGPSADCVYGVRCD